MTVLENILGYTEFSQEERAVLLKKITRRIQNKSASSPFFTAAISNIATWEINKYRRLMDKNFGLSEIEFQKMVIQLKNGDEKIFETIFLSHFEDCMSFIKYKYNTSTEEAYDASMQAMLAFCHRLKDGKITYGNLRFLFTQMAGQFHLKALKKSSNQEEFSPLIHDQEDFLDAFNDEDLLLLDQAWNQLGDKCKTLLNEFYYNNNTLQEIAQRLEKNAATIRKQKQRCIEKLRSLFIAIN